MSILIENTDINFLSDDLLSICSNDWDVACETFFDDVDLLKDFDEFDNNTNNNVMSEENLTVEVPAPYDPIVQHQASVDDVPVSPHVEDDVIRLFARSIETAINSHEIKEMNATLAKCCADDVTFIVHYPRGNPHGYSFKRMSGYAVTADYLHQYFESIPDSLFFIHDTKVNRDNDGNRVVKSKYTINGTRLHTLVAKQQGCRLPDAPAMVRLYSDIKIICAKTSAASHEYNAKGSVTFKKENKEASSSTKYDNFKEKMSTIGTHVEYSGFSESSMQSRKKKRDQPDIKKFETGLNSITLSPDSNNADANRVTAIVNEIAMNYQDCERFNYGDAQMTKFSLSPLLSIPVPLDAHGLMKLHMNRDNKVCLLEIMLYVKPL